MISKFLGLLIHNYLFDIIYGTIVIPKAICEAMILNYNRDTPGVLQLDGSSVRIVGEIKDGSISLHKLP